MCVEKIFAQRVSRQVRLRNETSTVRTSASFVRRRVTEIEENALESIVLGDVCSRHREIQRWSHTIQIPRHPSDSKFQLAA